MPAACDIFARRAIISTDTACGVLDGVQAVTRAASRSLRKLDGVRRVFFAWTVYNGVIRRLIFPAVRALSWTA